MFRKIFTFSNATLLTALALSAIAAWYSIVGLTAIFAGAVIPIIIMGTALEFGKVVTTVWLRKYWKRCAWIMKLYLVPAVFFLAVLTSMGIFGFLSKAHMDQGVVTGESQTKLAIIDEKIKTEKDNIAVARKALDQMDAQVDARLSRGDSENSAERAVQIRRQQANERTKLQKEIADAQKNVSKLNEERAPIAAENRKVEAEVGPIKYIAALIYGDNPDQNILERAVRWVIILLVAVFDPLALMLVIAANQSREWDNEEEEKEEKPKYEMDDGPLLQEQIDQINKLNEEPLEEVIEPSVDPHPVGWMFKDPGEHPKDDLQYKEEEPEKSILEEHPYLEKPFVHFTDMKPLVSRIDEPVSETNDNTVSEVVEEKPIATLGIDVVDRPGDYITPPEPTTEEKIEDNGPPFEGVKVNGEWVQTGPAFEQPKQEESKPTEYKQLGDDYVEFEGKRMAKHVLQKLRPDLFSLKEDNPREINIGYGPTLPNSGSLGDNFVKTDSIPHTVYKYNGSKWIMINKQVTGAYLSNTDYLKYLVDKISTGEYDPELLTDYERDAITEHIKSSV